MAENKILLVGDVVVDVTSKTTYSDLKLRLGGVVHAARCLWALGQPFAVAYFSPEYLDSQVINYLKSLGCSDIYKLGNIVGAPYVFLIEDIKEIGDQGYDFLLRDEIRIEYHENIFSTLKGFKNCLLISGNYDLLKVCDALDGNISLDLANNIDKYEILEELKSKLNTIFVSTSSSLFKKFYDGSFQNFSDLFSNYAKCLILKENRGGSRYAEFLTGTYFSTPAQTRPVTHSVGVGDVFDSAYIALNESMGREHAAVLSSWIAAEYATTTFPDDFKRGVTRVMACNVQDLVNIGGVTLSWEDRATISIYIAAPDFDFIDVSSIDRLVSALNYHNFKPRRPVRENGQMEADATKFRRQELFNKDMQLLSECSILIAVLLYNDPGTLIEIGLAAAKGIPTIVFDPLKLATNCMLTEIPTLLSSDLDEVISETFIQGYKLLYAKK